MFFESNTNNYQEKYKEIDEEKNSNICDSNSEQRQRSSCRLDIKKISDSPFEDKIKLLTKLYYADERDNSVSKLEKDFENHNCHKEIFRSSCNLDVEASKTDKAVLLLNPEISYYITTKIREWINIF